jgi:hypothetical protein
MKPSLLRTTAPRPEIHVTEEDIDAAMPQNSKHCMIVLAIRRAVPSAIKILVDIQTIRWTDKKKGLRYIYFTPDKALIALVQFDYGLKPKPFSFRLRGAQIVSARIRTRGEDKRVVHKLGRRKVSIAPNQKKKIRIRPDILGGKAPPLSRVSQQKAFSSHRHFGRRGLSMADILGERGLTILQQSHLA